MKKFLTFVSLAVILFACLTAAFRMADMPRTYQGQEHRRRRCGGDRAAEPRQDPCRQ